MSNTKTSTDALWKGIIENLFEDFLRFFYPDAIEQFDLDKGFEFLDKELDKLFKTSKSRRRYADKLVKVYTREGNVQWILIHIEVQGYRDPNFAARMFDYYYRILEKYRQPITALVIYTDPHPHFHPTEYVQSCFGTEMRYSFRTYKLLDKKIEDFADQTNPFSIVMETAWHSLKEGKLGEEHIASLRIRLIKRLFKLGYTKKQIDDLIAFIVKSVNFENSQIKRKFEDEIDIILQKRKPMGIQEAIIEDARWQGREEAKEEMRQEFEENQKALKKQLEEQQKTAFLKLREKGFSNEEITDILSLSSEDLRRLSDDV